MHNAQTEKETTTDAKIYLCTWSEHEHGMVSGTLESILKRFPDINQYEEQWFMWVHEPLALASYVTGGGVTLNEFHADSELWDKVECDNMEIMRVY